MTARSLSETLNSGCFVQSYSTKALGELCDSWVPGKAKSKTQIKMQNTFHIREWCTCLLERTHLNKLSAPKQRPSLLQISPTSLNFKVPPPELCSFTYTKEQT